MTLFESQVSYYKSSVKMYSTGLYLGIGSALSGVFTITEENEDPGYYFVAISILIALTNLFLYIRDQRRFAKLTRLS